MNGLSRKMARRLVTAVKPVFKSVLLLCLLLTNGCSVINFSANYYAPPANYQKEVSDIWEKVTAQLPLKNAYRARIIQGRDSNRLDGIPAVSDRTVLLPNDFVKYIYQNYYNDRAKILVNVMVHEICHPEFGLPSKPPEEHFKADMAAIKLLGGDIKTAQYYYQSLYVMKNYWYARKGVAGHALNLGWNAINGVSAVLGGPAAFADFYATDLSHRMNLIAQQFRPISRSCFPRSSE